MLPFRREHGRQVQRSVAGLQDDFLVLERGSDVGGTWRDNTYPGAACDVPSQLYSFSFAPNPAWSHDFSPREEIQAYLRRTAEAYGVGVNAVVWGMSHFHHDMKEERYRLIGVPEQFVGCPRRSVVIEVGDADEALARIEHGRGTPEDFDTVAGGDVAMELDAFQVNESGPR